jgi:hypothetical protein
LWNSITIDDILLKEFLNGCEGYVGKGLCFNPLGDELHSDYEESVISLCWCKFADDIDVPPLQRPRWGNQL